MSALMTPTIAPTGEAMRRRAMASLGKLPPFSAVMNKLMQTLADEDVSLGQVAQTIEQDAVMSGNVLKVVNSAAYGRRGTINSLKHAVSMLGLARVRNVAMSLSVSQMWGRLDLHPQWSPKQFYLHSTAAAVLADLMAIEIAVEYPEGAFTAGLLSGTGLLLLASSLKQEFTQLNRTYVTAAAKHPELASLDVCEQGIYGFTHNELSAEVLGQWELPAPIVAAVGGVDAKREARDLAGLVSVALLAAAQAGYPIQSWVRAPAGDAVITLEAAGLGERAERIVGQMREQLGAMAPFAA